MLACTAWWGPVIRGERAHWKSNRCGPRHHEGAGWPEHVRFIFPLISSQRGAAGLGGEDKPLFVALDQWSLERQDLTVEESLPSVIFSNFRHSETTYVCIGKMSERNEEQTFRKSRLLGDR